MRFLCPIGRTRRPLSSSSQTVQPGLPAGSLGNQLPRRSHKQLFVASRVTTTLCIGTICSVIAIRGIVTEEIVLMSLGLQPQPLTLASRMFAVQC